MESPDALALAKRIVRHRMRDALATMSDAQRAQASNAACDRIASLPAFGSARTIMLYLPMPGEADCTPLIESALSEGRRVCVPKADWHDYSMAAVRLTSLDAAGFEADRHGVRTPRDGAVVPITDIGLVIAPGLAFDEECHRLGRGGGFYDRFLVQLPSAVVTVGMAFEQQIVDRLPACDHDARVGLVATDRRVIGGGKRL